MPSQEFVESIVAALDYWHKRTYALDDQGIVALVPERQNLFRAVSFGTALTAAWPIVAKVALQAVPLVNRRLYYGEWIPVLDQLAARCPDEEQAIKFRLLIQLGRLQRIDRRLEPAAQTLIQAYDLAQALDEPHAKAEAAYNVGRLHLDRRDYAEGERLTRMALNLLEDTDGSDPSLVAWSYTSLGTIARLRGNYDEAEEYLEQAVSIRQQIGDPTGLARALLDLAINHLHAGRIDEAIRIFREANQLLADTANEQDKINIGLNLGGAYFDKGEWDEAEKTFRETYSRYLSRSGNLQNQAHVTVSLGNVLLKQGRLVEAEAYLRHSVSLWQKLGDSLNLANAVGSLGEVLAARGDKIEASEHFDEALALLSSFPEDEEARQLEDLFAGERKKLAL